jgi:hypothetical protein
MKQLLFALLLSPIVILPIKPANAQSSAVAVTGYVAQLTEFQLDVNQFKAQPANAQVVLDTVNKTVTLKANFPYYCPPQRMCAQVMPAPFVVTLPIANSSVRNGVTVYVALTDHRALDGSVQQITLAAYPNGTGVSYDVQTSGKGQAPQRYHSEFRGGVMTPINF